MRSRHSADNESDKQLGHLPLDGNRVMAPGFSPQSWLFVPANRPDRFEKALASGADAVIVDLEDAVEPVDKERARDSVAQWLSPSHPVLVRINARATPWFEQDAKLAALKG